MSRESQMSDDLLNRIYDKVEVLDSRLDSIDKTLVRQEANLQIHMKRSDHLEKLVSHVETQMKPIQKHVIGVELFLKFLGIVSVVVAIIAGIVSIISGRGM